MHVPLCRVARPRARVVVLMCPLHRPCVFWGWLCCSTWLWGVREEGSGRARAELGRCAGPQVQKAVLGELQWGDFYKGYQDCSLHCGGTHLGPADRAGGSGLCLAGSKGWTALWIPFPLPTSSLMSPSSSRKDLIPHCQSLPSSAPQLQPPCLALRTRVGIGLDVRKKREIKVM